MIYEINEPPGFEKETTKTNHIILSELAMQNIRGLRQEFEWELLQQEPSPKGCLPLHIQSSERNFDKTTWKLGLCSLYGTCSELASNIQ